MKLSKLAISSANVEIGLPCLFDTYYELLERISEDKIERRLLRRLPHAGDI